MNNQIFKVANSDINKRVDLFLKDALLKENIEISRSDIKKAIDQEKVTVNEKIVKASYLVKENDEISFSYKDEESLDIQKKEMDLDIVYEDDDLLIVNKPSGLVVHPGAGHTSDTLVSGLLYREDHLSDINGKYRPGIVHRIDKDTSGLLIVCKNNVAHEKMAKQIKNKTAKRDYYALVYGNFDNKAGRINAPIGRDPNNRQKQAVVATGKEAITHFKVIEQYKGYSLISCSLETGRTHQIRVHLAYINHPVYGDYLYGPNKNKSEFGQYLHAYHLQFIHPSNNQLLDFEVDLPLEFKKKINELKND